MASETRTAEVVSPSGSSWPTPPTAARLSAADGSYARATTTGSPGPTVTIQDFGFAIPAGATIDGVVVSIRRRNPNNSGPTRVRDNTLQLLTTSGTVSGDNKANSGVNWPVSFATLAYGSSSDKWGLALTPAWVNHSSFGLYFNPGGSATGPAQADIDLIEMTVYYTVTNTDPTIGTPTVNYDAGATRAGANAPATVTFTASDAESTGSNALDYDIRTASGGGGSSLGSGTCSSGVSKTASIDVSSLSSGTFTLYIRVTDEDGASTDRSFVLKVDKNSPANPSSVSTTPSLVGSDQEYTVTFSSADTHSTDTNECRWQVSTSASEAGLLSGANYTQGSGKTTSTIVDTGLTGGSNTRYIRTLDGAKNASSWVAFTVTYEISVIRVINATLGLASSWGRGISASTRVRNESVGLVSGAARLGASARSVDDAVGISESSSRAAGALKILNDVVGIAEGTAELFYYMIVRVITAVMGITEQRSMRRAATRVVTATLGLAEDIRRRSGMVLMVDESVGLDESQESYTGPVVVINAVLGIADSMLTKIGRTLRRLIFRAGAVTRKIRKRQTLGGDT